MIYGNCSEQDLSLFGYYIGFLYAQQPCLDQFSQHSASTPLSFFLLWWILSVHWQVLVSVKAILWGECFGWKSASLTPASSTWQFVLVCIARVCVSRGYTSACICLWTVLFFSSMIWPLIVLRKRKHTGSLSIFFHISFFLMSLCHFQTD